MAELAQIFGLYGDQYREQFGDKILPSHKRALGDITDCRTAAMGGHSFQCDRCGHIHYAYHSCKNRHCPKCHDSREWMEMQREQLLPVHYFHLVFTLPQELREIVRANQKPLLSILCQAAADSLMELALDAHYIGGEIGLLCVIHTWTRAMIYHPHVHCLVPGGGLSKDGSRWLKARKGFLVPVRALTLIFRAKFMEMTRKALPDIKFPDSIFEKKWVVYSKPTVQGTDKVLNYLARYVHRVAITNSRILSIENGKVQFRYKDSLQGMWKTMALDAQEFIRRFLQHVLPQGFHKIRSYGLLAPSNRHLLGRAKEILEAGRKEPDKPKESNPDSGPSSAKEPMLCPSCGRGHLFYLGTVPARERAPP